MRLPAISALLPIALWCLACGDSGTGLAAGDWARFRGPGGLGLAAAGPLPTTWGEGSANLRWRAELPGFGSSSPIVAGGRVYVAIAEERGERLDHGLVALDADSGERLWKTTVTSRKRLTLRNRFGVHSGATPVTDGRTVFAYYGAELAAVGLDGEVRWVETVEEDFDETTRYGAGSSPILVGESIVILQDKEYAEEEYDVGWLAAFDKRTGALQWRTEFDDGCCSYVTPIVRQTTGGPEIVLALARKVAAFSAATGELLWEDAQDMNQPVASPVLVDDLLCVASGAHNVRETVCRRLSGSGKETRVEVLWRTNRTVAETASPVLDQGVLYVMVQKGVITCYDALTGQILWRARLDPGAYHASLLAGDGKIYASNNDGVTTVLAAGPTQQILAVNDLGERSSIATPAISGGRLYVRTEKALVCIEPETS